MSNSTFYRGVHYRIVEGAFHVSAVITWPDGRQMNVPAGDATTAKRLAQYEIRRYERKGAASGA